MSTTAPALPDNAPVIFEMWDWSVSPPVLTSSVTTSVRGQDMVYEDAVYVAERGAGAWYHADKPLTLGDFKFGPQLFVSGSQNTTSGTQPLQEVGIWVGKGGQGSKWPTFPFADTYDFKNDSVFFPPCKIVGKDKNGKQVMVFEMRDGLPLNDKSLHQGYPTVDKPDRPKISVGQVLIWWNERPRRSASLATINAGTTDDGLRPSQAKSHYSFLGCEPEITGGYNRNSLNSLGDIWRSKPWAMPKASYMPDPASADPYANYIDCASEGHSAYMGPYVQGYLHEHGARVTHVWYTAPGGPRPDRAPFASQLQLWVSQPDGKRLDGGVSYADIAYNYALGYGSHPNHWSPDVVSASLFASDQDLLSSQKYFVGCYYGDSGPTGPNAIRINAGQRGGTDDSNYDAYGDMPYHGWGRDLLHDGTSAADAAICMQSFLFTAMSKWDTATAFMLHGSPDHSGMGDSYLVRDMAWEWLHHVRAWKLGMVHPLGFTRADLLKRFSTKLESINRDIVSPIMHGDRPAGAFEYLEGLVRFGQPLTPIGGGWQFPGGGLAYYLGGALMYMKQTGMWAEIQNAGGPAWDALLFTVRCACQYAFGIFSQTKATMFSNPSFPSDKNFADGTAMPADWAEFSAVVEGDIPFNPSTDVSIYPTMQFIHIMWDYFQELDHPWKKAAYDAVVGYEAKVAGLVAAEPDLSRRRDIDFNYRYPGVAPLKPPTVPGPCKPTSFPTGLKQMAAYPAPLPLEQQSPDPIAGGDWKFVCKEGETATLPDNTLVAYGAGHSWLQKTVSGQFVVSNSFFGNDPIVNVAKLMVQFVPTSAVTPAPTPTPKPDPTPVPVPTPKPIPDPVPELPPVQLVTKYGDATLEMVMHAYGTSMVTEGKVFNVDWFYDPEKKTVVFKVVYSKESV